MTLIAADQLAEFAPHSVVPAADLDAAAAEFGITAPAHIACWLGQVHVESAGLTRLVENLNYSAERLVEVWPVRFPNLIAATPFAHNPPKLAERVYGGRMSLGNTEAGDGFRFRGRGLLQVTGRANYAKAAQAIGVDLLSDPDLLALPVHAARSAAAFWRDHGLNAPAEAGDITAITRAINGGLIGLQERKAQTDRARAIWR